MPPDPTDPTGQDDRTAQPPTQDSPPADPPHADPTDTDPQAGALAPEIKAILDKERKARRDAEKRATTVEAELGKLRDRDKTELQRVTDERDQLRQRAETAEANLLRFEVAAEKKVPAELVEFITGTTREDIEASADKLTAAFGAARPAGLKPDPAQGARGGAPTTAERIRDAESRGDWATARALKAAQLAGLRPTE